MNQINSIGPLKDLQQTAKTLGTSPQKNTGVSFKDTLNKYLTDVNEMQAKADQSIKKMATGEITDVHQVMETMEEAGTAFNLMMEMRNKVMDAYQEIMRIRI